MSGTTGTVRGKIKRYAVFTDLQGGYGQARLGLRFCLRVRGCVCRSRDRSSTVIGRILLEAHGYKVSIIS